MSQNQARSRTTNVVLIGALALALAPAAARATLPSGAQLSRLALGEPSASLSLVRESSAQAASGRLTLFVGDELCVRPLHVIEPPFASSLEPSYPKTRIGGFGLSGETCIGVEDGLSLDKRWACGRDSGRKASGSGEFRIFDPADTPLTASAYGWTRLFQGREYIPLIDAYDFRARTLWPELGRFGQEDPAGTVDSLNVYQALGGDWTGAVDPFGLAAQKQPHPPEPGFYAIEGRPAMGALWFVLDEATLNFFSDEKASYSPFYGAGQTPTDLRAFKQKFAYPVAGVQAAMALRTPGTALKVLGVAGAAIGLAENMGALGGTSRVLHNEERLDAQGRHVLNRLTHLTSEAEDLIDGGAGITDHARLYQKYKNRWFAFFFRGRAIQGEAERLLAEAARQDVLLKAVEVRPSRFGGFPDFVFTQAAGEALVVDITSPRSYTLGKALKYLQSGKEIIAEVYHRGKGLKP